MKTYIVRYSIRQPSNGNPIATEEIQFNQYEIVNGLIEFLRFDDNDEFDLVMVIPFEKLISIMMKVETPK